MAHLRLRYIFIPVLAVLFMSHNVSAIDLSDSVEFVSGYDRPYWQTSNGESSSQGTKTFGNNTGNLKSSNWVRLYTNTGSTFTVSGGNFVSIIGQVVAYSATGGNANNNAMSQPLGVWGVGATLTGTDCHLVDFDYNTYYAYAQTGYQYRYNFEWICRAKGSTSISNPVTNLWVNTNSSGLGGSTQVSMSIQRVTVWKPSAGFDDSAIISRINAVNSNITSLRGDVQNTNDKLDELIEKAEAMADAQQQQQQQEQESAENISDQTPADMGSDVENQQTTSIINLFGSFLSALSNVQAGTCVVTLPFPSYAGGNWVMNICQYKDKAGNIISLFGSATLILFYLPVAWRLLSMIYNEIRSFTNG